MTNNDIVINKEDNNNNNNRTTHIINVSHTDSGIQVTTSTSNSKVNNRNDNVEQKKHQIHKSFLSTQYQMVEQYLKNLFLEASNKWIGKILQIKSIISNYSSPMVELDMRIDGLDEDDLTGLSNGLGDGLLLNTYSQKDILKNFEQFGIMKQLKDRNYPNLQIVIDNSDPFVHRVQVSYDETTHNTITQNAKHLLIDMFIRRKDIFISEIIAQKKRDREQEQQEERIHQTHNQNLIPHIVDNKYLPQFVVEGELYSWRDLIESDKVLGLINYPIKATVIEWLCLQDPNKTFSTQRPPLPGQYFPGLGIGKQLDDLFVNLATQQNRDCLLNSPYRFYNAFMYQSQEYFFIDPSIQGLFQSLLQDMEPNLIYGLAPVSWAFEFGCVKEKSTNKIVKWEFHQQARPISKRMKAYFKSKEYQLSVKENMRPLNTFYIDWNGHPSLSHFCTLENSPSLSIPNNNNNN